jgi:Domain of unknown function(DUF2779)
MDIYLTKSRYMQGLQCRKRLWLSVNKPHLAAEPDLAAQHIFDVGRRVGEYAWLLFDGGILVCEDHQHLSQAITTTESLVMSGATAIFEAAAESGIILCRADILTRDGKISNEWDIHEAKMNAKVEDEHINDLAIQRLCFERAGYPIRKTYLLHINTEYIRHGDINLRSLFVEEDVTQMVLERIPDTKIKAVELVSVLESKVCPAVEPGAQCEKPNECPFNGQCSSVHPNYSIYELSRGKKVVPKLKERRIELLKDVPEGFPLSKRHSRQVLSVKTKQPVIDKAAIKRHLASLEYPLFHFDFETINPALPPFENSRPYQQNPFQFSLHIQNEKCGNCEHHGFLAKEAGDPRKRLIEEMLRLLGKKGTIVAYHMPFEKAVIEDMATTFPEYSDELLALLPRFWDLIVPFRSGNYVHYDFHGRESLKAVLPVLVPSLSHKNLEIQEGATASLKYELWATREMDEAEWEKTYQNLLKYCELDTLAMVEILSVLYNC